MCAPTMIIVEIARQDSLQMTIVQYDNMILLAASIIRQLQNSATIHGYHTAMDFLRRQLRHKQEFAKDRSAGMTQKPERCYWGTRTETQRTAHHLKLKSLLTLLRKSAVKTPEKLPNQLC